MARNMETAREDETMMRKIPLSQEKYALVDDADYRWLDGNKWYASSSKNRHTCYALRHVRVGGKEHKLRMHRFILGLTPGDGKQTDHIDGNGLNNQRANLRICTRAENQHNRQIEGFRSSQYKGVYWHKRDKCWYAHITINDKKTHLGCFSSEIEAGRAYNKMARKHFGEYARVNRLEGKR